MSQDIGGAKRKTAFSGNEGFFLQLCSYHYTSAFQTQPQGLTELQEFVGQTKIISYLNIDCCRPGIDQKNFLSLCSPSIVDVTFWEWRRRGLKSFRDLDDADHFFSFDTSMIWHIWCKCTEITSDQLFCAETHPLIPLTPMSARAKLHMNKNHHQHNWLLVNLSWTAISDE